jgi:hypothetical protein
VENFSEMLSTSGFEPLTLCGKLVEKVGGFSTGYYLGGKRIKRFPQFLKVFPRFSTGFPQNFPQAFRSFPQAGGGRSPYFYGSPCQRSPSDWKKRDFVNPHERFFRIP